MKIFINLIFGILHLTAFVFLGIIGVVVTGLLHWCIWLFSPLSANSPSVRAGKLARDAKKTLKKMSPKEREKYIKDLEDELDIK